jgi:hypothetical protein
MQCKTPFSELLQNLEAAQRIGLLQNVVFKDDCLQAKKKFFQKLLIKVDDVDLNFKDLHELICKLEI